MEIMVHLSMLLLMQEETTKMGLELKIDILDTFIQPNGEFR